MSDFLLYPSKFIPPPGALLPLPHIGWLPKTNPVPDDVEYPVDEGLHIFPVNETLPAPKIVHIHNDFPYISIDIPPSIEGESYTVPLAETLPAIDFVLITNSFPIFVEDQAVEGESYIVPLYETIVPAIPPTFNIVPETEEEAIQNTSFLIPWERIVNPDPVPDLIIVEGLQNIFEEEEPIQNTIFMPPFDTLINLVNIGWAVPTNIPADEIEYPTAEGGIFSQIVEGDFELPATVPDFVSIINEQPYFEEHQTLEGEFLYGGTAFDADGIEFFEDGVTVVRSILDHFVQDSIESTDWILIQKEDGSYRRVKATIVGGALWIRGE